MSTVIKFFLLGIITLLAGCQTAAPELPTYPAIHFTAQQPFHLNVSTIQIVQEYTPPLAAPNVEHLSPITPSSAVRTWANDRLKANGRGTALKVVIKDASIIEKPLPRTEGWEGIVTQDQSSLYTAHLLVKLEVYGSDPTFPESEITANVSRSKSIREDASVNDRQALLYELTKGLIDDANTEIEKNIRSYLGRYMAL